ncbi:MAG: ketopantoate reductase family protein, partial [Anaerolineae bacterium]
HLRAIQRRGLRVESVHGDFTVHPAQAVATPAGLTGVDLILFATKTDQIEAAAEQLRPVAGPQTAVLPLHNGVDASERIAAILPPKSVLGGACWVVSAIVEPGLIRQQSQFRRIALGELDGRLTPRVEQITAALQNAGATAEASTEINVVRWSKFLFIASFSGMGAVTRAPAGEMMACAETRQLLEEAMREVEALARARGLSLAADIVPQTMAFCRSLAPGATASMQRDIMAGRPSELEAHNGFIARLAAELNVPAPVHRFIYGVLLPQERRARGNGSP